MYASKIFWQGEMNMMNRRQFITQSTGALAGAAIMSKAFPAFSQGNAGRKPNIIAIVADDLTPKFLGCYGGPTPTPHLDALAAKGVRFTAAHCTTPLCNPSRYTLLTGQFPGRNPSVYSKTDKGDPYWLGQSTKWTPEDPSIARSMKQAGYLTAFVGKWHSNFELGTSLNWEEDMDADDPAVDKMLRERHEIHRKEVQRISGFDHVANLQVGNLDKKSKQMPKAGFHNPEWQTQGALDFIDQAAGGDQPFFIHLANSIPHSPDNLKSLEQDPRYTQAGKLDKAPEGHPARKTVKARLEKAGLNMTGPLASINAGTVVLDDQLAAIEKKLEQHGMLENTMIIWFADHSIYGKGTVYTPGTHVPMIISWPGVLPEGKEVKTPVSLVDLFPTCVAAGGGKLPDDTIDGVDLMALMRGRTEQRDPVYMEVNWHRGVLKDRYHFVAFRPPQSVLDQMEKGEIEYAADQAWGNYRNVFGDLNAPFKPGYFDADQLYDLESDPFERVNLAYHPAYREKVKEMKGELEKIVKTFERPFPVKTPAFMESEKYAELVAKRKQVAKERFTHYPEPYDAERIYNLNLLDPLALVEGDRD